MGRRAATRTFALALAAGSAWAFFATGDGMFWMLRTHRHVSDVMLPTIAISFALAALLARLAARVWRRAG